jgi:hypothetical protein
LLDNYENRQEKQWSNPGSHDPNALLSLRIGDAQGTMSANYSDIWMGDTQLNPICTDDKTNFHWFETPYDQKNAGSLLTDKPSSKQQYFRLDAYAAWYFLKNGECDYSVDRSDQVVDFIIEGFHDMSTSKFTILSCGNDGSVADGSVIAWTSNGKLSGNIVCDNTSAKIKYIFSFDNMTLAVVTPTATP